MNKPNTTPSASNTATTITFKHCHLGQAQVMDSPARVKVVACGRRWGKTSILTAAIAGNQRCWWLAPTRQMASQVWRDLKRAGRRLSGTSISESERRIDLARGGMIAVHSAWHPDNLCGCSGSAKRA